MIARFSISLFLILGACNSQSNSSKSLYKFYNTHLFFDLDNEVERNPCAIQGTIPAWLSGTLLRNGPAKFSVGGEKRVSWFDGLAMLHAFEFTLQEVLYSNRFLRCEQYYIMVKEKSLNFLGFAQDPCPVVFKNQISRFIPEKMKNIESASVTIQDYVDMMVALTEAPLPVVFDPKMLDTIGILNTATGFLNPRSGNQLMLNIQQSALVPDHENFYKNLRPDFSVQQRAEYAGNLHQVVECERKAGREKMGQISENLHGRVLVA